MGKCVLCIGYLIFRDQQRPLECRTREQLDLFLARAGSSSLFLSVECPPNSDMLKVILSRNCGIGSLSVMDEREQFPGSIQYEDFKDLDMGSLEALSLVGIDPKEAEMLMDLASQSTYEDFFFNLQHGGRIPASLFRNDLFKRASGMNLVASEFCGD
jgi:hypothetical protein